MESKYVYTSSPDYIRSLDFDHIQTYSFQRGPEIQELVNEFHTLRTRKFKRGLTEVQEKRYNYLEEFFNQKYLINKIGTFHPLATLTHNFKRSDPQVKRIISILERDVIESPEWMCSPIYRDAIVFYDINNKILSSLNICFSCDHMATTHSFEIRADTSTYKMLKQLFLELGHQIENR